MDGNSFISQEPEADKIQRLRNMMAINHNREQKIQNLATEAIKFLKQQSDTTSQMMARDPKRVLDIVRDIVRVDLMALDQNEAENDAENPTTIESIRALKAEILRLKEEKTCKICFEEVISVVFIPCGHAATCAKCSLQMRLCPICRTPILDPVKVSFS